MQIYDVIVVGAGAAGIFAAAHAIKNHKTVAIIDMGNMPLRKVFVSGGGRCNFTNTAASHERYFGQNPDFIRSALTQFTPDDMLIWAKNHGINTVQKSPGQYFCTTDSQAVIDGLMHDVQNTKFYMQHTVQTVSKQSDTFIIKTQSGVFHAKSVIIATGGLSYANLGVSDVGLSIARGFGHKIVQTRPALCGIELNGIPVSLAGASVPVTITIGKEIFNDNILFTHWGLGGPGIYRATVRDINNGIHINLLPDAKNLLLTEKVQNPRRNLATCLSAYIPASVAKWITGNPIKNMADFKDAELIQIATNLSDWFIPTTQFKLRPLRTAEVIRGGVSTADISSKTMESKLCPGLFFAGEVLDIAGDLGGFNLQWAWSSGFVAGNNA